MLVYGPGRGCFHNNTYIKPFLGNYRLSEITAEYIQSLYGRLAQKGLKPWSIIKVRNIINGALEQAVKNRYIPYNPTHATVSPKIGRVELKIFSPAEQRRFMESIKGNRLEALYNTALATGLRLGEILSLTWENVNFEKSEITVVSTISRVANKSKGSRLVLSTPKSKSSRRKIPMLENLKSILLEHKNRQDEERKKAGLAWHNKNLVFCSNIGTYIEPRRIGTTLKKLLEDAGLDYVNFHSLRHAFATRMFENGASMKAVQEILGHSDAALTINTYAHIFESTAHNEILKINRLFGMD